MKKKVGKTIQDAKARVGALKLEYLRAVHAYGHWLSKESGVSISAIDWSQFNLVFKGKKSK